MAFCITHQLQGNIPTDLLGNTPCIWVSCPPPELPVDWMENLVEPSPAEMERMELSAKELELQFS